MRRNLETRLRTRWEDLHLPTIVRGLPAAALLVHDRTDSDVSYEQGVEMAEAWPGARLMATDGLGHRGLLRDAGVMREVVGFLGKGGPR
jgi:hypothetical protein